MHIHSKDPRKKIIMDKLKQESGGRKVTLVTQVKNFGGLTVVGFEGYCHSRNADGSWNNLGRYFVHFELNPDGSLGQHIFGGKVACSKQT